jgi:hypothetical protein
VFLAWACTSNSLRQPVHNRLTSRRCRSPGWLLLPNGRVGRTHPARSGESMSMMSMWRAGPSPESQTEASFAAATGALSFQGLLSPLRRGPWSKLLGVVVPGAAETTSARAEINAAFAASGSHALRIGALSPTAASRSETLGDVRVNVRAAQRSLQSPTRSCCLRGAFRCGQPETSQNFSAKKS